MVNVAVEDWVRWNLMTCRKEQPEEEQRQDEEKEERSKKRKKQVFWPSFHAQGSRVGSFPFDIIQSKEKNDFYDNTAWRFMISDVITMSKLQRILTLKFDFMTSLWWILKQSVRLHSVWRWFLMWESLTGCWLWYLVMELGQESLYVALLSVSVVTTCSSHRELIPFSFLFLPCQFLGVTFLGIGLWAWSEKVSF